DHMKLGLGLGYWSAGPPEGIADLVATAESLGFDSMWSSEAYGSDVLTPLAWLGSHTRNLKMGTAIAQKSARTTAATAIAAKTLDHLSGGRVMLCIGASGPQVVEGWYGQPYPRPLARTREYIAILRKAMAREKLEYDGEFFQLPHQGGTGLGKALRSTIHPLRTDIPILLAAGRPTNGAPSADHPPIPHRYPDTPGRRRTQERRPVCRNRRRLAADVLQPLRRFGISAGSRRRLCT